MKPEKRQRIRHAVRYFYDVQKLRVQSSNRASGQAEGSEIVLDEEDIAFLGRQGEGLEALEAEALKEVKRLIKGVPIYEQWLKNQSGCGPTMSGVILSEIDIHICDTASKLWAYCGLAVEDDGRTQRRVKGEKSGFNPWLKAKMVSVLADCIIKASGAGTKKLRITTIERLLGDTYLASPQYLQLLEAKFPELPKGQLAKKGVPVVNNEFLQAVVDEHEITLPALGGWVGVYENYKRRKVNQIVSVCMGCRGTGKFSERAKGIKGGKKGTEGKEPGKSSVCSNCNGTGHNAPWGTGAAHRNMAAKRYMIKMFLLEMWRTWRTLEGLPIGDSYAERFLGVVHGDHGYSAPREDLVREKSEQQAAHIKLLEEENARLRAAGKPGLPRARRAQPN